MMLEFYFSPNLRGGRLESWVVLAVAGVLSAGFRVELKKKNMLVLKRLGCLHMIRVRLQEHPG